ncbi:MAG: PH domain-containing protein [Dermatophilus congolensis]|nr:PH domain-containing protein [Dermatophilus congolensis]
MTPGQQNNRALRSAEAFLLPEEEIVVASNKHWIAVAEPVVTCLLSFALVVWVNSAGNSAGGDLFWWLWFAIVARTAWCLVEWKRTWFIVTDQRLLKITGMVIRKVAMMPIKKITDVNYDRTIPGQILRYGSFRFETPGQDQAFSHIDRMPHPNEMYRAVVEYVLGAPPKAKPANPGPPMADPTPTRPMTFDFPASSAGREEPLYKGGAEPHSEAHSREPDTDSFVIPGEWKRTDDEVAQPKPQPRKPNQLTGDPVQHGRTGQISGRSKPADVQPTGPWWRRSKPVEPPSPQHHSLGGTHSIKGNPHEVIGDRGRHSKGPIIEVKGQKRRDRRSL